MIQIDVSAQVRKNFGKGAARTLRRSGKTPAVLYGPIRESIALTLDTHSFTKTLLHLQRRNAVLNVEIDTEVGQEKRHVMIKEIQVEPVTNTLEHADFYEIALDKPALFTVPVKYTGKARGVDMGGDMTISVNQVKVKGNPLDIPDEIEVDVTPLGTNEQFTCQDLVLPANVSLVGKKDKVCVAVVAPVKAE
ncbi:MAG: 50S ribosomal protein L25 [Desulfobulbaceae bacterium DB1]|nr:MAG: 50S ribosomal protein L25 [Desulfobulbaceae bacterium DB1]